MAEKGKGRGVRLVKVVLPPTIIKEENVSEDEETVTCSICYKSFASDMALRNHAMMEHFEAFSTNNPDKWTEAKPDPPKSPSKKPKIDEQAVQVKKEGLLSIMAPGKLTALANEDVNYIIVKSVDSIMKTRPPAPPKKPKPVKERKKQEEAVLKGPFECTYEDSCHRIFFSCCEYSIHYRDEHTRRRTGHRCQVCEKPLAGLFGEEQQGAFTCEVCAAVFESSEDLASHTSSVHVKIKPYHCELCLKRFTQQGGLVQHMRMHTGDRPFFCTFCPKAFTQKSGLDQHLRIHTKVKPYRCVVCAKTFCQSVHLRQHMRTHTNVAPFECSVCHQKFKQASHRNYHLRYHNPAELSAEQREIYDRMTTLPTVKTGCKAVQTETPVVETESIVVECEQTVEDQLEQVIAEQSIQIVEGDEYIITEVEPWES